MNTKVNATPQLHANEDLVFGQPWLLIYPEKCSHDCATSEGSPWIKEKMCTSLTCAIKSSGDQKKKAYLYTPRHYFPFYLHKPCTIWWWDCEILNGVRSHMRDLDRRYSISLKHHRAILEHDRILIIQYTSINHGLLAVPSYIGKKDW